MFQTLFKTEMRKKKVLSESEEEKKENEQLQIALGNRIKELRKIKGINQTELANLMNNRDRQVVQRLEKGKTNCSLSLLRLTAMALEVDIKELLEFKVKK